jgi:DNA-directed RNA polymerase specialized sigma24 family protein
MCAREQLREVLSVAVKTLPERYQKVVLLYYTKELTMKEIGGIMGINESRVSQIHKTRSRRWRRRCTQREFTRRTRWCSARRPNRSGDMEISQLEISTDGARLYVA